MPKPNETIEQEEKKQIPNPEYTDKEIDYRSYLIKRLTRAKDERDKEHTEFDDMDYYTWYEKNAKAANAYIPPKLNKQDTRIVTGTTQEKSLTLLSAVLNYNLEPNIEAFDKLDMPISELGENMEDMVKKSRKIENYEDKRVLIYKELLDQGTVFTEELYAERFEISKKLKKVNWLNGVKIGDINWKERFKGIEGNCEVNLLPGTKVYLGNVKEFDMIKQPFAFTAEMVPYEEIKMIFRNWERFENVPRKITKLKEDTEVEYQDWSLNSNEDDMVEVIKYQDKWKNDFMIMLNGVMMLPVGFPLSAISPSGEYTISKGVVEPISKFFAYGKSTPSKSKTDQSVLDEMLKLIVLKTQQSFMPPLANNSNKILSRKIFFPGKITSNIDVNLIKPLVEVTGVTQSEFNTFELIKKIIDEKTVSPVFSGDSPKGNQTATEIMELKKQQMMKLGLLIWGIISLEKQITWLRIHNILQNWTKSTGTKVNETKDKIVNIYRTMAVDTELENGQSGTKIIEFNPEKANMLSPGQIKEEEDFLSEPGKPVRKTYLNPNILRTLKALWYIVIIPTEKDSSELNRVLFVQNIQDAANIFGIQTLNMEYLKGRFAILAKEDPDKFFNSGVPTTPNPEQQAGGQAGGQIGKEIAQGVKQPSLNQMVK